MTRYHGWESTVWEKVVSTIIGLTNVSEKLLGLASCLESWNAGQCQSCNIRNKIGVA